MATIQQQYNENEDNQKEQGAESTQQLSTGSQSQSTGVGGQGGSTVGGGARYQTPEKKGSGRFMNLQKYLDANTGAGSRLAGGISSMANREGQKVEEASSQADQISQNIQNEKDRLSRASGYNEQVAQGQAQNVAQNNLDEYTQLRLGQNDLSNIQQSGQEYQGVAKGGINRLQGIADQATSEAGRFNLLRQAYGGGKPGSDYGLGQRRLDQLFLQAEGGGQLNQLQQNLGQTVDTARDRYQNFQDTFGQGVQDITDQTAAAQQAVQETLGGFQEDGTGAFGNIYSDLAQAQSDRRQDIDDTVDRARRQLQQRTISQSIADELGLTSGMQVADLDLAEWANRIQAGDTNVTMADVISDEQQAQLGALQQLAGIDPSEQYLGEREGSTLDFNADEFGTAARDALASYDDRFFDRNVNEILGRQYFYDQAPDVVTDSWRAGYGKSPEQLAQEQREYVDANWDQWMQDAGTLEEEILRHTGLPDTSSGWWASPLYGRTEDWTSRDQLQQSVDQIGQSPNHISYDNLMPKYQALLDAYDRSRNQNITITPDEDIETGGYFNVT